MVDHDVMKWNENQICIKIQRSPIQVLISWQVLHSNVKTGARILFILWHGYLNIICCVIAAH
jgi:hypothetical protein